MPIFVLLVSTEVLLDVTFSLWVSIKIKTYYFWEILFTNHISSITRGSRETPRILKSFGGSRMLEEISELQGGPELYEWFWKVWEGPDAPVSPRCLWDPRTGSHFSIMPYLLRINLVKSLVWDLSRLSFSSSVLNVRKSFLTFIADRQVTCKKIKRKWKRLIKNRGKSLTNEVS